MGRPSERPAGPGGRGVIIGVCVLLAVAVLLVFGQTLRYEFVNYDDGLYVYENTARHQRPDAARDCPVFTHIMRDF